MKYKHILGLVFLIILIDQLLKFYIKLNFEYGSSIKVLGLEWFQLYFIENSGMAFGMKIMDNTTGKTILTLFRLIAVSYGFVWVKKIVDKGTLKNGAKICIAMILAGAAGNLIDSLFYGLIFDKGLMYDAVRGYYTVDHYDGLAKIAIGNGYAGLMHGSVVDMLYFPIINTTWPNWVPIVGGQAFTFFDPIFNFADFAISFGVITLLVFQKSLLTGVFPQKEERNNAQEQ